MLLKVEEVLGFWLVNQPQFHPKKNVTIFNLCNIFRIIAKQK